MIGDKFCGQSKPEERELLSILYYSKQTVSPGLTDDGLASEFNGERMVKEVSDIFAKPELSTNLVALENYPPDAVTNLFVSIAAVWYDTGGGLPEGAPSTTWAAQRMKTAVENIRAVEIAKRSAVLKLLVHQKDILLPSSAEAVFDWSHAPTVTINLVAPAWTAEDISALKRLQESKIDYYRISASKVLEELARH